MLKQKGSKKAEFFPEKVIITDINEKGEIKKKEIEAPTGYTFVRGDGISDALAYKKYNRGGEKKQTLPVVNLSYEALHHLEITYVGKDTIQLPDKVIAKVDHFSGRVKETFKQEDKAEDWIDDKGKIVLATFSSPKRGDWISYEETYQEGKNKGIIRFLKNGQYFGSTEWEITESENGGSVVKLETITSKLMGGFTMTVEFRLDQDYNPITYIEHWKIIK